MNCGENCDKDEKLLQKTQWIMSVIYARDTAECLCLHMLE